MILKKSLFSECQILEICVDENLKEYEELPPDLKYKLLKTKHNWY